MSLSYDINCQSHNWPSSTKHPPDRTKNGVGTVPVSNKGLCDSEVVTALQEPRGPPEAANEGIFSAIVPTMGIITVIN